MLAHYDQKLPIKLTIDSSSYALGAIISHTYPDHSERPIAYASRVLSDSECKFPQIEKEGLAIIFGIQKFYDYLYGRKFTLVTDHKPLIHIFGEKKEYQFMRQIAYNVGHTFFLHLILKLSILNQKEILLIFYHALKQTNVAIILMNMMTLTLILFTNSHHFR